MNTITRRTALAASATLPLLPVSAFATPADPAVEAYEEWRKAHRTFLVAMKTRHDDDDPVVAAANDADHAAAMKFAETVPTTLAGLAALINFTPYCFGQVNSDDDDWTEPGNYSFGNWLCDDREDALCRSMQAGIKQIAEAAS